MRAREREETIEAQRAKAGPRTEKVSPQIEKSGFNLKNMLIFLGITAIVTIITSLVAFFNKVKEKIAEAIQEVKDFFEDGYDGMVFQGGIPVKSLCSHHHLAFTGVAHVAYIPSLEGRVIGLSKLNRIVEFYARRPQIQEGLTMQIHKAISDVCEKNLGVAVMVSATHTCACNRGVRHDGCEMNTSKLSGDFLVDPAVRAEFYQFISHWTRQK